MKYMKKRGTGLAPPKLQSRKSSLISLCLLLFLFMTQAFIAYAQLTSPQNAQDTTIISSFPKTQVHPNSPYSVAGNLLVGDHPTKAEIFRSPIRFDLSSLPPNAVIQNAKLELFHNSIIGGASTQVGVHELLQTWNEGGAFSDVYDGLNHWDSRMADGTSDFISEPISVSTLDSSTLNTFVSWNIKPFVVDNWVLNPLSNTGFILRDSNEQGITNQLHSSNHRDPTLRPKFTLTYTHGPRTTLTLQPGSEGQDTTITSGSVSGTFRGYANLPSLDIGENPQQEPSPYRSFFRFNLAQIPGDALVHKATFELFCDRVQGPSTSVNQLSVFEALKPWTEQGATSILFDGSSPWESEMAQGSTDISSNPISLSPKLPTLNQMTKWDLNPSIVQKWILGLNNGLVVIDEKEQDVVYTCLSSDNPTANRRPRLTISFTRRPTVTTIIQPAGTQTPLLSEDNSALFYPDGRHLRCGSKSTLTGFTALDAVACQVEDSFFCKSDGTAWSSEGSGSLTASQRDTLKDSGNLGISSSSCCSADSCWDGSKCIDNMASDPTILPVNNHRCINGDWSFSPIAMTWDKTQSGFCPELSQCLIDLNGDSSLNNQPQAWLEGKTPQCIDNGQFVLDHYCSNKIWTTRTKLIGLEMLNLVNQTADLDTAYTLYCDTHNSTLIDTEYQNIKDFIVGPAQGAFRSPCLDERGEKCVNNFCILDYTDRFTNRRKHVVGVSLNKNIDDSQRSFLQALNKPITLCNTRTGTGPFQKCGGDGEVWFNPTINSLMFSRDQIQLDAPSPFQKFLDWFDNPITNVINWITGFEPESQIQKDFTFTKHTTQFNRLYISRNSIKSINAVQEDVADKAFILARYENFDQNLCDFINNKATIKGITPEITKVDLICEESENDYSVFTDDKKAVGLWNELTAELQLT
jgi:hypothetical protein